MKGSHPDNAMFADPGANHAPAFAGVVVGAGISMILWIAMGAAAYALG